jgi:hypothetical protein
MPSGFNPDHGLPSLRTDAPDAAAYVRALYATGYISDVEADDLLHSIEHAWLLWEKALDETLIDQFIDDIHDLHTRPGRILTTDFAHERSKRRSGAKPDHTESIDDLYVKLQTARQVCMHKRIARFLTLVFQAKPLAFQQLLFQQTAACREMDSVAGPRRGHRRTCLPRRQPQAAPLHSRRWPEAPGRRDAERAICPKPGARVPDATARASSSVCQEGRWILLGCRSCASWPPAGPAAVVHPDVLRDAVLPGDVDAALVQGEGKARASSRIWIVQSSPARLPVAQAQRGNPADADLGVLRLTGVG